MTICPICLRSSHAGRCGSNLVGLDRFKGRPKSGDEFLDGGLKHNPITNKIVPVIGADEQLLSGSDEDGVVTGGSLGQERPQEKFKSRNTGGKILKFFGVQGFLQIAMRRIGARFRRGAQ